MAEMLAMHGAIASGGENTMTVTSRLVAAVALIAVHSASVDASSPLCAPSRVKALVSAPVQVTSAEHVPAKAEVPAHCAVSGFVEHGTRIGFTVALPEQWNKKFLFLGIGGFAGVLQPLDRGIAKGYATGTTDTGHQGTSLEDATWALNNPAGIINHYETGVELAAQAVKGLTTAYYGAAPAYAYFEGCSAGGRQGLIEAQRFPGTFDGIIAAAPAWNYSKLLTSFIENGKEVLRSPDRWLPPEAFAEIDHVVIEQCDAADGVQDTIISDPRACKADLRELLCKSEKTKTCLTPAQLGMIDKLLAPDFAAEGSGYFGFYLTGSDRTAGYSWGWPEWFFGTLRPMPDRSGQLNFARNVLPKDADRGHGPNQFVLGEQFFRYIVLNDPAFDARTFTLQRDAKRLEKTWGELVDADDTDLGTFVRLGGKLLIWHGWSDPAIPPEMAIDLHTRIVRDTKPLTGQVAINDSVRLFMAPGVQHCGGGFGLTAFDPLPALERWVEQGEAPERIEAVQMLDGKPARSRPLCPYPAIARYRGKGNPDDAASFACK
jgi:hypothetical protein